MVNRTELFIVHRNGTHLLHFDVLGTNDRTKNVQFQKILPHLQPLLKGLEFPKDPLYLRMGKTEARCVTGTHIITYLLIDCDHPLHLMTEAILLGLLTDVSIAFEKKYQVELEKMSKAAISGLKIDFNNEIHNIIENYGLEAFELYQKLILIEAIYANLPADFCIPLMEKVSAGEDVIPELEEIPDRWKRKLKDAVEKVNTEAQPVWEIFSIPLFKPFENAK
jgi:hypothetical protein